MDESPPGGPATPPGDGSVLTVDGDLTVADGAEVSASIRVLGNLQLGTHARATDDVHVTGDAHVGDDASVSGLLRVEGAIQWGRGARAGQLQVAGPLCTGDGVERARSMVARRGVNTTGDAHREGRA